MPPYLTPMQVFENYKKANLQKCKGKSTTEICKLAGLNDKQIAELKKTSAWLFCFDEQNTSTNQDINMTEILGGNFSKRTVKKVSTKSTPKMSDKDCAQMIFNQIKDISCYWKTEEIIKNTINKDNVVGILKAYKDIAKRADITALSHDIDNELALNYETVKKYVVKSLIQKAKELKIDMSSLVKYDELKNLLNVNEYISLIVALIDKKEEANKNLELASNLQKKYARPKFNPEQYTLENLKKQYPAPQYKIEISKDKSEINVKNSKDIVIKSIRTEIYDNTTYKYVYEFDNNDKSTKSMTFVNNQLYTLHKIEKKPKTNTSEYVIEYNKDGGIKHLYIADSITTRSFKFDKSGQLYYQVVIKTDTNTTEEIDYDSQTGMIKSKKHDGIIYATYHNNGMRASVGGKEYFSNGVPMELSTFCELIKVPGITSKQLLEEIKEDNILDVVTYFKNTFKQDFFKFIKNVKFLLPETKEKYLRKFEPILIKASGFDKNYKSKTRVSNKYYTGDNYNVKFYNYKAVITNTDKQTSISIDLDKLLNGMDECDKIIFAATIQRLPGEALTNLAKECNKMYNRADDNTISNWLEKNIKRSGYSRPIESAGYAGPFHNITTRNEVGTIIHELGHLIDFYIGGMKYSWNSNNKEVYTKEQKNYLLKHADSPRPYYEENIQEYFAEFIRGILLNDEELLDKMKIDNHESFELALKCYKDYMHS